MNAYSLHFHKFCVMVSALRCTSITFYFYVLLVNNPPCAYLRVPFHPRAPSELACLPEGFQPGRGMPSKIECETEIRSMEDVEDTIAETKTLKVSEVSGVIRNEPSQPFGYRDLLHVCQHVAQHATRPDKKTNLC